MRLNRGAHDLGRWSLVERHSVRMQMMPWFRARYPNLARRGEQSRIIQARRLKEFYERRFRSPYGNRGPALDTKPAAHGAAALCRHGMIFRFRALEPQTITRNDEHSCERASTCALAVSAMANELHDGRVIGPIPHASTRATTSKAADRPLLLLWPDRKTAQHYHGLQPSHERLHAWRPLLSQSR
jgi:hypothetical protein